MDYHAKKMDDRRMRTGKCRLSFPHVFEVYSESGKYQVQLIIPKTDKETIALISALEKNAQEEIQIFPLSKGKRFVAFLADFFLTFI